METRATRIVLVVWVIGVLLFLFVPIATIVVFAFDRETVQSWPIQHYTTHWFSVAWHDQDVRDSIKLITESPFIPNKGSVRGFVYDVETGALREVSPA